MSSLVLWRDLALVVWLQVASIQQEYPRHVACGMMAFIQQDPDTLEPMPGSQGMPGSEPSSQVRRRLQSLPQAAGTVMTVSHTGLDNRCSQQLLTELDSFNKAKP